MMVDIFSSNIFWLKNWVSLLIGMY